MRRFQPLEPRRLKLHFLHYPRSFQGPNKEWELHHGFRIRILARNILSLCVGRPPTESDLLSCKPEVGETSFLLIPAPHGPNPEDLALGLELASKEGWSPQVTLILSDDQHLSAKPGPTRRALKMVIPKSHNGLVLWVWQQMPAELCDGLDFFNAEQILHQLGRIGRRVKRRARWRKLLPF